MRHFYLIAAIAALIGSLNCAAQKKNHNFEVTKNLEAFSAIYKNLDMMYVDSLDPNEVIGTGIRAMLRSLDPYTEYYPVDQVKNLKQMFTGKYAGVGSTIRKNFKTGNVIFDQPYAGMPAAEVGVRKGDEIISIDDSTMLGKDVSYVSDHLRGDAGTTFLLKIRRPCPNGVKTAKDMTVSTTAKKKDKKGKKNDDELLDDGKSEIITMKVTRRAIQLPAVPYYGMLNDSIGYINLDSFTDDCSTDFRRAYIELKHKGMHGLIFDLRGNGGGSLAEAVKIVNMFVPKGITLVRTKGKIQRANHDYVTESEPLDTVMPITVLVDGNTASASEITAGSLQDLDRATILGTRTYGKGLVQVPMDLPHNESMKLTTAKYYIPSGRCIQAINYKHSGGGYKEHIPDSLTKVFYTVKGREVRDGGGIKPDIEILPDSIPNIAFYLTARDSSEVMLDWVVKYIDSHPTIAPAKDFRISDADWADFKKAVIASDFKYDQETSKYLEDLIKIAKFEGYYDDAAPEFESLKTKLKHNVERDLDTNATLIRNLLNADITAAYYFQGGSIANQNTYDKQIIEACKITGK